MGRGRLLITVALVAFAAIVLPTVASAPEASTAVTSSESRAQVQDQVAEQLRRDTAHDQWLQSDAAVLERQQSLTAFDSLDAAGARSLIEAEFGDLIADGDAPTLVDPSDVAAYLDSQTARVDGRVVVSSLPLLAENEKGDDAPTDFSLDDQGDHFEVENPLVDLRLPDRLRSGIQVGTAGELGIGVGAAGDSASMRVSDGALLYPNVAEDSDLLVSAQPAGVELSTQLRSPDSPETQRLQLDLPPGAKLVESFDGSIDIARGDQVLGRIHVPIAVDAQGQEVPVSMRADGDFVIVETSIKGRDVAFPVLSDPLIEYYVWPASPTTGWSPAQTSGAPYWIYAPGFFTAAGIWAFSGTFPAGAVGEWTWSVPHATSNPDSTTAWISEVTFGGTEHSGGTSPPGVPVLNTGIWNTRLANWNALQTRLVNPPLNGQTITATAAGSPPAPIDDGQMIRFQLFDPTAAPTSHGVASHAGFSSATMTLNDPEPPTHAINNNTFPAGWVKQGTYSFDLASTDPGLGVKYQQLYKPTVGATVDFAEPNLYELDQKQINNCTGGKQAPCPQSTTQQFSYGVSNLAEGRNKLFVRSLDPLANPSADPLGDPTPGPHVNQSVTEVRVDRSGPTIKLTGDLTTASGGDVETNQPYGLDIQALDGSTQSAELERSGVKTIKVFVNPPPSNAQPVHEWTSPDNCPEGSCEKDLHFDFNASSLGLGPGHHTVVVKSTDMLDQETTKTIPVTVKGFVGVIVTPESGDTTARRLQLEAERHDESITGVTFEFRRPGTPQWQPVPWQHLRLEDGATPTADPYPLPLNQTTGRSAPVTWDLPKSPGIDGINGGLKVRARFSGPGGPPAVVADHPSLYWRLGEPDGTAIAGDSSGNDRNGIYVGTPDMIDDNTEIAPEDDDGAVDLNGSNQYISTTYAPFANGSARTFVGWANRETQHTLDVLIGGDGPQEEAPWLILGDGTFGAPANDVNWYAPASDYTPDPVVWANAWPWPGTGQWVHWALVVNQQTFTAELYINGVSKGARSIFANTYSPYAGPLLVGASPAIGTPGSAFDGKFDEVAVYERPLSQAEVQNHMSGSQKGFSQVVPVTLDRDTTTSKHASAPIGPGNLDLLTGNFSLTQDDVKIDSYGSDLTFSRTLNSREAYKNPNGPFGPGWISSVPVDAAGSDYVSLAETGPAGDPKAVIKITTSDSTEILFNRQGSRYQVEEMFTGLELTTEGAQYVLRDLDGNATTFFKPSGSPNYLPLKVRQTGHAAQTTTRFGYETAPGTGVTRVKWALAPVPVGVSCTNAQGDLLPALPRGCRALTFDYTPHTAPWPDLVGPFPNRLNKVTFHAWDPDKDGGPGMVAKDVAQYEYSSFGLLSAAWDPRIPGPLKTTYGYSVGGVSYVAPPGENPWTLQYQNPPEPGDPNWGRLRSVTRNAGGGIAATTTTVGYDVSLSGGSGAPSMNPGDVDDWGQTDAPTDATAIFPPNPAIGASETDLAKATITYMNRNGDAVNVATPNEGAHAISTMEYEEHRMVRRELSPENRARALAAGSQSAATALALDTEKVYAADGKQLTDIYGPVHEVMLDNGNPEDACQHTHIEYDQGRPTGQDYHLPTAQTVGAQVVDPQTEDCAGGDVDVRTTTTEYNWALRQPEELTVDPGGLDLVTRTAYDQATGIPIERRLPKASAAGDDAHTTKTILWKATGSGECEGRPEWANLPCKVMPGGQPGGPASDLPVSTFEYNLWNQPTKTTETPPLASPPPQGSGPRISQTTYDQAGRPTQMNVTGGLGHQVPAVTTTYSPTTGRPISTSTTEGGTISRGYDAIGRQTTYTDADGATTETEYDLLNRPTRVTEAINGTEFERTFGYYATSGRLMSVGETGAGVFTATEYDADGKLIREMLPNGLEVESAYNSVGEPTNRIYRDLTGCAPDCELMQFQALRSIHGQVRSDLAENSSQTYQYDAASRLINTEDTVAGECTTRHYQYDADSNRTQSRSVPTQVGGVCDPGGGGQVVDHVEPDEADRYIDPGYEYDAFGRTLSVPAADAGGSVLEATYYRNDRVHTLEQAGVTRTFELDPANRVSVRATTGQPDEIYHYADDTDSPSWTEESGGGSDWSRSVGSLSGELGVIIDGHGAGTIDEVTYQLTNLHGDVVGLCDAQGNLTAQFDADEFGVPQGAVPDSDYGWLGGKERRSQLDSGVITMGARVYVPQMGRFLQTDPVAGGSANDYDYANQDPTNQMDLDGTKPRLRARASFSLPPAITPGCSGVQVGPRRKGLRLMGSAVGTCVGPLATMFVSACIMRVDKKPAFGLNTSTPVKGRTSCVHNQQAGPGTLSAHVRSGVCGASATKRHTYWVSFQVGGVLIGTLDPVPVQVYPGYTIQSRLKCPQISL